ncbi:MAG TPA: hypothetical protein VGJ20_18590 [Xanthobacteraceae bacterium]
MRVGLAHRRDIGVVEQFGSQLQIAGIAQNLGSEIMVQIVEAEAGRADKPGAGAHVIPDAANAVLGHRVVLALNVAIGLAANHHAGVPLHVLAIERIALALSLAAGPGELEQLAIAFTRVDDRQGEPIAFVGRQPARRRRTSLQPKYFPLRLVRQLHARSPSHR